MKYGIEIEFAAPFLLNSPDGYRITDRLCDFGFNIGIDASAGINNMQGYEIKNAIPFEKFNERAFKGAVDLIKTSGGRITKTSGVHIHFSGGGDFSGAGKAVFTAELIKMGLCWKSRRGYCQAFYSYLCVKYVPLNHIRGDHYEVRSFNGTFNIHAIRNYLDITNKLIKMAQKF